MSLTDVLTEALKEAPLPDLDKAAVQLAYCYAEAIDNGGKLVLYGPRFLAVLNELGMTPKARAAVLKNGREPNRVQEPPASPLDELRERRNRRAATRQR